MGFILGGNAGMAAAYVARKMGVPATIVVPSSSPPTVIQKLKDQGAAVQIVGKVKCDKHVSDLFVAQKPDHFLFFHWKMFCCRFGMTPTQKLSDWQKLKDSLMFLRSITPCCGRNTHPNESLLFVQCINYTLRYLYSDNVYSPPGRATPAWSQRSRPHWAPVGSLEPWCCLWAEEDSCVESSRAWRT